MSKLQKKPSALKKDIQHFKTCNLFAFFYVCVSLLPSWIRIWILGPNRIQSGYRPESGSTALIFCLDEKFNQELLVLVFYLCSVPVSSGWREGLAPGHNHQADSARHSGIEACFMFRIWKFTFFCLLLFETTFTSYFKEKNVITKSQNRRNQGFSYRYYFCLVKDPAVLRIRIRDPVPFWPLDPGSGIGFFRIPDLGSRIPNPYIWEHIENFFG